MTYKQRHGLFTYIVRELKSLKDEESLFLELDGSGYTFVAVTPVGSGFRYYWKKKTTR